MDASTEPVVEGNNDENDSKADKVSEAEVNNTSTSSEMAENEDKTSEGAANTSSEGEYWVLHGFQCTKIIAFFNQISFSFFKQIKGILHCHQVRIKDLIEVVLAQLRAPVVADPTLGRQSFRLIYWFYFVFIFSTD